MTCPVAVDKPASLVDALELWLDELPSSEPPEDDQDGLCDNSYQTVDIELKVLTSITKDSENLLGNLRASSRVGSSSAESSSVSAPSSSTSGV